MSTQEATLFRTAYKFGWFILAHWVVYMFIGVYWALYGYLGPDSAVGEMVDAVRAVQTWVNWLALIMLLVAGLAQYAGFAQLGGSRHGEVASKAIVISLVSATLMAIIVFPPGHRIVTFLFELGSFVPEVVVTALWTGSLVGMAVWHYQLALICAESAKGLEDEAFSAITAEAVKNWRIVLIESVLLVVIQVFVRRRHEQEGWWLGHLFWVMLLAFLLYAMIHLLVVLRKAGRRSGAW